jgi:hypothetical protein
MSRNQAIQGYLTAKSAKVSEATSDLIESIRIAAEDIKDVEASPINRAKVYSELAAYFAQMASKELNA